MSGDKPCTGLAPANATAPHNHADHRKAFTDHAELCWKAEEANAARLATRSSLVLSAIAAVIGLKLFAIGKEFRVVFSTEHLTKFQIWFMVLLALSFILVGCSLWLCLNMKLGGYFGGLCARLLRREAPPMRKLASVGLRFPDEIEDDPKSVAQEDIEWASAMNTYTAFLDLTERNNRRNVNLDRSQTLLFFGIMVLVGYMCLYAFMEATQARREAIAAAAKTHAAARTGEQDERRNSHEGLQEAGEEEDQGKQRQDSSVNEGEGPSRGWEDNPSTSEVEAD